MPGVGIDLIEIERVERALARRPRLAERLFTDAERTYAASRARPGQHLAARFAAKEAVLKALGLEVLRPREIEVARGERGAPVVVLHGVTAREAAGAQVALSLTHTRSTAGAVAVRA
jgi:holo-[acyl-carrier protein] synthase